MILCETEVLESVNRSDKRLSGINLDDDASASVQQCTLSIGGSIWTPHISRFYRIAAAWHDSALVMNQGQGFYKLLSILSLTARENCWRDPYVSQTNSHGGELTRQ